MELETDSSPRPNSFDHSQATAPGSESIHSVVRISPHAISKSIIDMDATPTLDATGEIKGTAPSNPVTVVPSSASLKTQKTRGRIQFAVLCWTSILAGINDGCTGPLLPRIQEVYHVGHRDH
jgi:hypothetical protein